MGAVEVGSGGNESSGFDAAISLEWIGPDEIKGDVFEQGQIVGGGPGAGSDSQKSPL